ncbi:MAG: ABC transporter permease [Bryobacterales bacterium]|nr:ABC transporter permease [Bryobacterales bacterium]
MLFEILLQAWDALRRNPVRSALTMLGIVWGIASVTLLMAYGDGFRGVLVRGFDAFGKTAVIARGGQTSEQAGGERAGRRIQLEKEDLEAALAEGNYIKHASLEAMSRQPVEYNTQLANMAVRGVYPQFGEIRNEVASEGRWLNDDDIQQARRVVVFGSYVKKQMFGNRSATGETVRIAGVRFTVIGTMDPKMQLSNYFSPDDRSIFIPFTAAAQIWNTRYVPVIVFSPINPEFEQRAIQQFKNAVAKRQRFSPKDPRALNLFGREQFRPIIDGITIGLQTLLYFIGLLTLGIGGVGLMNIMLVAVQERTREIGLRLALGAKRRWVLTQFMAEALAITAFGGLIGIALSYLLAWWIGSLPMLGALFQDDSGRGDLVLQISPLTLAMSTVALFLVGLLSGMAPAIRASRMDPATALRWE